MEESIVNQKFYDIINGEDWDEVELEDTIISTDLVGEEDVPITHFIVPTPIPGVYINIKLGFNVDGGDDYA
jgi:hypothetical protein